MTIVINEIEINVQVTSVLSPHPSDGPASNPSQEAIVKECVEKVLEIIHQKNER